MGRVKRNAGLAAAARIAPPPDPPRCALCRRLLGMRIEFHHLVPKSEGGNDTVPLHPICHRAIHAAASNAELGRSYATIEALAAHPDIRRFLDWVADKPSDFHAPTFRRRN